MKKRENFTIDEEVMKDFEKYVSSEKMSKSATVENLIKEFLNDKKRKSELIEKEQVDKLSELIDQLGEYKNNITDLSSALYEVIDDEVCCELLKESDLYNEIYDLSMNLPIDYDYLAYEVETVYVKAVDILKKKNNSKFLLKDYLSDELSPVDEDYIRSSGVDYDEWVKENEKLGLDINRYKYLINPNILDVGNVYYFGDKVASNVILGPGVVFNETFGLKRIAERERLYANNNDALRFHPEFNQFALYYFLKDYKEIDTGEVFNIFESLYFSITEKGVDKIPTEIIEYVMQYSPYTTDEILSNLNDYLGADLKEDDTIEVYKCIYDSSNLKSNLEWDLEYKYDKDLDDKNGFPITAKVKIKDILATYISQENPFILAFYNDMQQIEALTYKSIKEEKEISIDDKLCINILEYIFLKNAGAYKGLKFHINDIINHFKLLNINVSKKELIQKILKLPYINDTSIKNINPNLKYDYYVSNVNITDDIITVQFNN